MLLKQIVRLSAVGILAAVACSSGPRLTPDEATAQARIADSFWTSAEAEGIDRDTPFRDARDQLRAALHDEFEQGLNDVRQAGVRPTEVYPYCIRAFLGGMALELLGEAASPTEAAREASSAIGVIRALDKDIADARRIGIGGWTPEEAKRRCEVFEDETRATRGWPPRSSG